MTETTPTRVWDYEIFLSHNSRDKPAVEALARRLLEAGVKPWLDKWDLVPGENWLPAIEGAMRACPAVAVCVGPSGFGKVHDTELQAALNATYSDAGKRVLPVLLPGAAEGGADVPEFLKLKTWIDYRREDAEAFDRLVKAARGERPGAVAPDTSVCPYRGLEPFRAEHARFFYGREREVAGLLESLAGGDRLLFLVGASGSGKSSLVLAGVVPAVQSGQLDDSYRWRVVSLKPGADPCRSLARALLELGRQGPDDEAAPDGTLVGRLAGPETDGRSGLLALRSSDALLEMVSGFETRSREVGDLDEGRTLLARLERAVRRAMAEIDADSGSDRDLARELTQTEQLRDLLLHRVETFSEGVAASLPHDASLLLVIDQFEELFTLTEDAELRNAFLEGVLRAVRAPGARVHAIVTARADFLGKFLADPVIAPLVQSSMHVALSVMDREQIERAIRGPAGQVGLRVDDAVVDDLVDSVAGEPGDLPLLQFTLYELWRLRSGGRITWDAYAEMGRLKGAIATRAEQVFEGVGRGEEGAADQRTLRRIFGRLVQLGEGTEDTRRRATRTELRAVDAARADGLVERLVEARLLTAGEHEVEVAHEAVIREWSRLRHWIDEDRGALRLRQELGAAEGLWSDGGQETGDLWRGGRLERTLELDGAGELDLGPRERAFLDASAAAAHAERQATETRRQRELQTARELADARGRSSRRLRMGVVAASILAVLAAAFLWLARSSLQLAQSRQIAFVSETVEHADGMLSLLLAYEAVQTARTPEAIKELYDSLTETNERLVLRHPVTVHYAAWNAAGDHILTHDIAGTVRLWSYDATEPVTARPVRSWRSAAGARWDQAGTTILLRGDDGIRALRVTAPGTITEVDPGPEDAPAFAGNVPIWPDSLPDLQAQVVRSIERARGPETPIQYLAGHLDAVTGVALFPPEQPARILTVSEDNTGRVWDLDGRQAAVLRGHEGSVLHGAWHPRGRHVITASKDTTVRVWEVGVLLDTAPRAPQLAAADHRERGFFSTDPSWDPVFTRWSPDGASALLADDDGQVRLYPDAVHRPEAYVSLVGHQEEVRDVDWYPADGPRKILTTSFDHTARFWTSPRAFSAQDDLGLEPGPALIGHLTDVIKGRWSPDGLQILTVGAGGTAYLWNESGQNLALLGAQSDKVLDAFWGADRDIHVIHRDGSSRTWPGTVDALLAAAEQQMSWTVGFEDVEATRRALTAEERARYRLE